MDQRPKTITVRCGGSELVVPAALAAELGLTPGQQIGAMTAAAITARKFEMAAQQKKGH